MRRLGSRAKEALLVAAGILAIAPAALAGGRGWETSYDQAIAAAKKTGKLILADFNGSDWCGWCIKLRNEVFDKRQFKAWASKNVVLLDLDFPRRKRQSAELKAQNEKLMKKYGVQGFPTILFLDAEGKVVGRSGYKQGGPEVWCRDAQRIVDDYRKFASLQLAVNLTAARARALKDDRPLLVIVSQNKAEAARREGGLFKHPPFVKLVNSRMVAAHVDLGKKASANRYEKLKKDLKIEDASRFVLIDARKKTVLYQAPDARKEQDLVGELTEALPRILYDGGWLTDFAKAGQIAAQEGRPMMLDFTGSDWCGWCVKLKKEVFSTERFKSWAGENLVLVELDFPRRKRLSAAVKSQNLRLARKYGIRGFPTIIVLDSGGRKIGELGYTPGGPGAFIGKLKAIIARARQKGPSS